MRDTRKLSIVRHLGDKRRSITEYHAIKEIKEYNPPGRSLQMLAQDREGDDQFICESIEVVDACRGTSNSYRFRGNFLRYEGPCREVGFKILDGYLIYKTSAGSNEVPKYMYCFGDNGGELNGYTSSTIDIHCNDRAPPVGYNGDGTLNMGETPLLQ